MSNFPGVSGATSERSEEQVQQVRCEICSRVCISSDEGCTWKDSSSGKYVDADRTPDSRFVCSAACSSQAMYEAATEEERAALHLLANWNESTPILQKAFLAFNPYQRDVDVKHRSVWERWNSAYDVLKLFKLVEKIGHELTGDDEAPAWYREALSSAPQAAQPAENDKPERKPVQSIRAAQAPSSNEAVS